MKRDSWPVTPADARPAGKPDECFYCHTPMEGEHLPDCVCRDRTVVIAATFELVVRVPENWDAAMVDFHLNESSSCDDNVLVKLDNLSDRLEKDGACLCANFSGEYLREATEEDEGLCRNWIAKPDPDDGGDTEGVGRPRDPGEN